MKFSKNLLVRSSLAFTCAMATLTSHVARAHPYASSILDTNAVVNQGFGQPVMGCYLNESATDVTVIFDQGLPSASTNDLGAAAKGLLQFPAPGGFTTFQIIVSKVGTGSPSLISVDTDGGACWTNGSGVAINKNPKIGALFGRVYASDSFTSGGSFAAGGKVQGVYAMNPDLSYITNMGPAIPGVPGAAWSGDVNGNFKGPSHLRVAPNNKVLVSDGQGVPGVANANQVYLFEADLSSAVILLGPSKSTGAGDHFGTPVAFGSLETGDLVLYTAQAGLPTPNPSVSSENTNCIRGPNTAGGSFNCVFRYNIGSGPLPWNKRPDWAYTVGLDGIAQLRPEVDVADNGIIYAGFGRANLSNPNLQILRPAITTNSPFALSVANNSVKINFASQDPTNWLYTSGVTPPNNSSPAFDPWNGINGGGQLGMYGGVRRSPDGVFFASMDDDNGLTLANLTNNVPDDGSIFGIANASSAGLQAGMDWDAADNIWAMSRVSRATSAANSAQSKLRGYSLGLTTTCITSNDWTGTNGSFQLTTPGATAKVAVSAATGTQNYCNNGVNPGNRLNTPAKFTINLSQSTLAAPVTVTFVRTGGTLHGLEAVGTGQVDQTINAAGNYDMAGDTNNIAGGGYWTNSDGVALNTNSVIFPAGTWPHAGNWSVDVPIYAAAVPISGPTFTVAIRLLSGANYSAVAPVNGTVAILNTGPQLLQLSAASPSSLGNMNRGIANDQARFTITRLGDTNGPGNDSITVNHTSYTVTNFTYLGTAQFPLDYTARAQNFTGVSPVDGSPGITIPPGAVTISGMIGNPVKHTNPNQTATNVTVVLNLTNSAANPGTNLLSSEGLAYSVNQTVLTLNEFDNAHGGEVVIWSNPLKDANDSTNWTVVFANINQAASPVLPTVVSNYDNSHALNAGGDGYIAGFGKSVLDPGNDGGVNVPQSDTMLANNWTNALKVSVNKNPGNAGEAGINLYPASGTNVGTVFNGNYALRFDMFLSLYDASVSLFSTANREFAAFGVNHYATNANWRLDSNPRVQGNGSFPINADGTWCCIDAAINSITPADYDLFVSPAFIANPIYNTGGGPQYNTNFPAIPYTGLVATNQPFIAPFTNAVWDGVGALHSPPTTNVFANGGVPNDRFSLNNNAAGGSVQNGVIKTPPFGGITNTPSGKSVGGAPVNKWVDVSFEMKRQTNISLYIAGQQLFADGLTNGPFGTFNALAEHSGVPMLGYLDPNADLSGNTAFAYFSNMRVVELSPFIPMTNQPVAGLIVTQGQSFTLSSAAIFASNPLTNEWYFCTTNGPDGAGSRNNGTPTGPLITNTPFLSTSGATNQGINNILKGTNFVSIWRDQAGSVTGYLSVIEVVNVANKAVPAGLASTNLAVTFSGNGPITSFQWKTNGVNLANNAKFQGVTTATLTISNTTAADTKLYTCTVGNAFASGVNVAGTLTVSNAPSGAIVSPAATNAPWGSPVTFTVSASGDLPFTYQWKKGGNNIAGATDSSFTLSSVTGNDAGAGNSYTVGVTNSIGGTISSAGVLSVAILPYSLNGATMSVSGGNLSATFTTANSFDTQGAFTLLGCGVVTGPYTNVPGAVITGPTGGPFSVTAPTVGDQMYYRLQHNP